MNADEKQLLSALRALAREEEGLAARPQIEARLMRAWDESRASKFPRHRMFVGPVFKVAAALVLAESGGTGERGGANPPRFRTSASINGDDVVAASETLPWLDPERGSFKRSCSSRECNAGAQGYASVILTAMASSISK